MELVESSPATEHHPEMNREEASGESSSSNQLENWTEEQDQLKKKLIAHDDFPWKLPSSPTELPQGSETLKYVGGVDISFSKDDSSVACACLVVLELPSLRVVHNELSLLRLQVPYVPGFLAFREAPVLLQILEKMRDDQHPFYPQVLMVDGNGILHPRGFGLACHLGVLAHLPTIGVGKNLHHVDGLDHSEVRRSFLLKENEDEQVIKLVGNSGFTWGVGFRPTLSSVKPIYVSLGHRISLDSAVEVVKMTCKYRVPEPIRQADMRSRAYLQKHLLGLLKDLGHTEWTEH
ncbi:PREDICTED: endonuclease V isoform X2 [Brassica oleracea var. oleracea]|uniref:endonuclease V isoform X2 n=1 Tax=Brassica oleracea var. oleracea TaxID=109376 RepID=UPI0006A71144|nr:PREDICTED: endonuclease V isoform X2 [Brassica oleracea var. oleracea]